MAEDAALPYVDAPHSETAIKIRVRSRRDFTSNCEKQYFLQVVPFHACIDQTDCANDALGGGETPASSRHTHERIEDSMARFFEMRSL